MNSKVYQQQLLLNDFYVRQRQLKQFEDQLYKFEEEIQIYEHIIDELNVMILKKLEFPYFIGNFKIQNYTQFIRIKLSFQECLKITKNEYFELHKQFVRFYALNFPEKYQISDFQRHIDQLTDKEIWNIFQKLRKTLKNILLTIDGWYEPEKYQPYINYLNEILYDCAIRCLRCIGWIPLALDSELMLNTNKFLVKKDWIQFILDFKPKFKKSNQCKN